jgi:murein DD-endopeptidase MepM/ murein hydrolase activator NlpD
LPSPGRNAARRANEFRERAGKYPLFAGFCAAASLTVAAVSIASGASGGAGVGPAPTIADVRCKATADKPCIDRVWVAPGGLIELRGRYLASVTQILFYGAKGPGDDVGAPAGRGPKRSVTTTVPANARSGPLAVVTGAGVRSRRWSGLVIDGQSEAPPLPRQTGGAPAIGTRVAQRKVFYGGLRNAVLSYRVASSGPVDMTVNLRRVSDGAVVQTWRQPQVQPDAVQKVVWDGKAAGKVQPEGFYTFQTVAAAAAASSEGASAASGEDAFAFYGHMLPVRGRHDFGGASARFGASRQGHIHQGQDVFASCGTRLVAARAGKVIFKGYHSLAGYYLVIHGSGSDFDYSYAHLRQPALVEEGERVYTGQQIGEVGESGNAEGCHLHLELWSAPGWYKGGRPLDPLPELKRWDAIS